MQYRQESHGLWNTSWRQWEVVCYGPTELSIPWKGISRVMGWAETSQRSYFYFSPKSVLLPASGMQEILRLYQDANHPLCLRWQFYYQKCQLDSSATCSFGFKFLLLSWSWFRVTSSRWAGHSLRSTNDMLTSLFFVVCIVLSTMLVEQSAAFASLYPLDSTNISPATKIKISRDCELSVVSAEGAKIFPVMSQ